MVMHYGQDAVAGIIRALVSVNGLRGPVSSFMLICVRLMIDQSLENLTEVGASPW